MFNCWKVDFYDNDDDNVQVASFQSKRDADNWIINMKASQQYDPTGFEVSDGPYSVKGLWFDSKNPAPIGFTWIKSVEDFADGYVVDVGRKFDDIDTISIDTALDNDGRSFEDILTYFENVGLKNLKVDVHGNDSIKKQKLLNRAKSNGWKIVDSDLHESENDFELIELSEYDDDTAELSYKKLKKFAENVDLMSVVDGIANACVFAVAKTFGFDPQKFKEKNPKIDNRIRKIVGNGQYQSHSMVPFLAVKYPSTDVNMLVVGSFPSLEKKSLSGVFKFGWKLITNPINIRMIPFKIDGGKIVHDTSEKAYMQIAMTLLLSDIEFDALWPTKANISPVMKYLDFICPSLIDVFSIATVGGASIAARAVKISAKIGAKTATKGVIKAGAKTAMKKFSKDQLKLIAKISKNAPKTTQKSLKNMHKSIKKAKQKNKVSQQMKNNLKNQNTVESQNENFMLTEGKHWPEDYVKTAYNLIKNSQLGQQSWYSDEYIKKDLETFVNEFAPLSHKNSNLGFFMAIIRWFIEYSGTSAQKYQEFIEGKLDTVIKTLLRIVSDKSFDSQRESIKKMPFADFEKLAEEINSEAAKEDIDVSNSKLSFEIVPIYSYDELHDNYGGDFTGYKGQSIWCHTNGKNTYDSTSWTNSGQNMFFVIQARNWISIKAPNVPYHGTPLQYPEFNCYDEYGMSLIAILVDVQTNKLLHSTSRWNHVILPKSGAADSMFESWQQLNKATGLNVEDFCKHECEELKKKLDDESTIANEQCAKILKNAKIITDVTIPKEIRQKITEVVIPDSVTIIGSYAFYNCTNLTSVTIPNSVTSIMDRAFSGCSRLTSVTIGNGVTSIGYRAFYTCKSLTSVTIPDSVTSIGSYAFRRCSSLTSMTIPNSVTSIGEWVFSSCSGLTSVTIPESVTSIGEYAFYDCNNLKSLIFKGKTIDQVKSMKNYPFGIEDESIIKYDMEKDKYMNETEENMMTKIWVDDVRPAPNGYVWLKSTNDFIDYVVEHGIHDIAVFDFDHDAGEFADDGGDYIRCLDYLENIGADNINIRIHSSNPAGKAKMQQIIAKNQWNEVDDIYESTLTKDQQLQLLFESVSFCAEDDEIEDVAGEEWIALNKEHFAYSTVENSLKDGILRLTNVHQIENSNCYVAQLVGEKNCQLNPQKWLVYLESIKKFIQWMFSNGCGDVWLIDANNDCLDDVFTLRIGFVLKSSPFSSDKNFNNDGANAQVVNEDEVLDEQEDTTAKSKIVKALKKATKDFQNSASNNDPEQFAKIVVAFDDLIGGVGKYDFKKKRQLKEVEEDENEEDSTNKEKNKFSSKKTKKEKEK